MPERSYAAEFFTHLKYKRRDLRHVLFGMLVHDTLLSCRGAVSEDAMLREIEHVERVWKDLLQMFGDGDMYDMY